MIRWKIQVEIGEENRSIAMNKVIPIVKQEPILQSNEHDDKHLKVMEAILPYARQASQKNLSKFVISESSRKNKIRFFLLPEWAKNFPPYNLARLVAVARQAGFSADCVDLNIKAWNLHKDWNINFDPWNGSKEWKWIGENYFKELHQYMIDLLEIELEKIQADNIDVVGFTLYYCNQAPTDWMADQIKKRYPHVKILVGGPQCHAFPPGSEKSFYDYVISGEGEQMLLSILIDIDEGKTIANRIHSQVAGERLDLDLLPPPDYSDFDFSAYDMPNGVNMEFSRGCVAKCVFCSETHFWKYRGRRSASVLNEILDLHNNFGIDYIWFLDSLVNGNLKELRALCKGIIAAGIKINWTGYARCDERMDFEYMKDLADSGCHMLSYGIESGSDKVLLDMDKKVTVNEIEQNLQDGAKLGITAHSNWIIGFPTEQPQDFYETMTLIWRNRNCLAVVAAGHGFTEPPDTILSQNSSKFGLIKSYYMNNWITKDFSNSKVHRLIRLISINIFLKHTPGSRQLYDFENFNTSKYHSANFEKEIYNEIEFEKFDFKIINPSINPFADSLVNEIWPLLRILWRTRGAYKISIDIDKDKSYQEFGDRLGADITASYRFSIDTLGNWKADFDFKFKQTENAWRYQDYSRETSLSAKRARSLAIPSSNGEISWTEEKYKKDMELLDNLKNTDFSFDFQYTDTGKWIV